MKLALASGNGDEEDEDDDDEDDLMTEATGTVDDVSKTTDASNSIDPKSVAKANIDIEKLKQLQDLNKLLLFQQQLEQQQQSNDPTAALFSSLDQQFHQHLQKAVYPPGTTSLGKKSALVSLMNF